MKEAGRPVGKQLQKMPEKTLEGSKLEGMYVCHGRAQERDREKDWGLVGAELASRLGWRQPGEGGYSDSLF